MDADLRAARPLIGMRDRDLSTAMGGRVARERVRLQGGGCNCFPLRCTTVIDAVLRLPLLAWCGAYLWHFGKKAQTQNECLICGYDLRHA